MKETSDRPVKDREKERRRYVLNVMAANSLAGIGCILTFGFAVLAAFGVLLFVFLVLVSVNLHYFDWGFVAGWLIALAILGGFAFLGNWLYSSFEQKAR